MKTLNLTHVGRLAELAAGRAWSTIPLRGSTLDNARAALDYPMLRVGAVMNPLRVNPAKSVGDIVAQRQRLSQALSKAVIRNTGNTFERNKALMKRGAVIRAIDDYVIPHANPLLGKRFREMQAILRTPVVAFASGEKNESATRKTVRRIGIGTAIAGAATLPAAIPMLKIAARNKIPGAGGNVPAKFIPDYITAGQRALNGPLTGKIAGAVIQRKRAATTPGTLPRFMADHYARFRAGPREALGHWQYEVGEALANKIKAKGGDVAANPAMKRFLTGAQATQNKINEGLWQHGLNETEAIRRALADPSKPVSDYGRLMMTHKAAASMKYAKIAAASPALLAGGGAMAIAARKRQDREKAEQMQAVMRTPVRFFAKADPSDPKRLVQLRGPAPAKRQKPEPESWISRNKWKLAGAGAMLTGIGVMSTLRDKGMKMPFNPHQSVGQELVGIKSQAAKDYEASMRAAAKKAVRADKKVSTAAAAAIQPEPATPKAAAAAAPKQPAAVKRTLTNPEVIQRATDKAWTNYKAGKLSGPKVLRVYQKFWGASATKGTSIPDTFTGKSGSVLRGRARSLAIDKLKKSWGPVAPMPKGQGSLALASVARMPIVFFNAADPDQFNQYAPTLYVGSMYRKGRRALTWVKRSGNIAQDVADTAAGKAPEPGRKREWEKSWFKNAVAGAAVGAGLYGTPRLYASLVGRKTGGRIRPHPTWGGLISSVRAGEAKNLLPQKKLEAALRTPVQFAAQGITHRTAANVFRELKLANPKAVLLRPSGSTIQSHYIPKGATKAYREQAEAVMGIAAAATRPNSVVIPRGETIPDGLPVRFPNMMKSPVLTAMHERGHAADSIVPRQVAASAKIGGAFNDALSAGDAVTASRLRAKLGRVAIRSERRANSRVLDAIRRHGSPGEVTAWRRIANDQMKHGYRNPMYQAEVSGTGADTLAKKKEILRKLPYLRSKFTNLASILRTPVYLARGDQTIKALARWGKNTGNLNGVRQQLAISGFLWKAPQTLRLWGKEGVARYRSAVAEDEDLVMRRRAGQLSAAGAGLVHLEDWRLADMRGNSARVFSPKAKTRNRREKTEWEKVSTIRAVRNGAIAAAVGLGGLSAYLGVKNMKLRRAAGSAPAAGQAGNMFHFPRWGVA